MKKFVLIVLAVVFSVTMTGFTIAAETKGAAKTAVTSPRPQAPRLPASEQSRRTALSGFAIVSGSLTKIDTQDPENAKLEVQSERDNKVHVITVTPLTSVAKMTDISELKTGEQVRVMTRKAEDKEVALNIMFGKLRRMPAPRQPAEGPRAPAASKSAATKAVKK